MELPRAGQIVGYCLADEVGRIRLDDGTEVRFGASALLHVRPVVGMKVVVQGLAPHALGGLKALEVYGAETDEVRVRHLEAAFEAAAIAEVKATREITDEERRIQLRDFTPVPTPLTEAEQKEFDERTRQLEVTARAQREADLRQETRRREAILRPWGHWTTWAQNCLLHRAGLSRSDTRRIAGLARPAAVLVATPSAGPMGCGASKLGGVPDVTGTFEWPVFCGRPLAFLGQVRLADIPKAVRASLFLPPDGLLSFFYDAVEQPWGYDPAHRGGSTVTWSPDVGGLAAREPPANLPEDVRFPEMRVRIREERSLPGGGSPSLGVLGLDPHVAGAYKDALDCAEEARPFLPHFLGGYAMPIQQAMEVECALVTHGVPMGGRVDRDRPDLAAICAEAPQWRLLLQLELDEAIMGTWWGSSGRLYFWIREDDLRARRFELAWCLLQCT